MSDIPAEAIEAAAKALHAQRCDCQEPGNWQGIYSEMAQTVLAAALPHLQRRSDEEMSKLRQDLFAVRAWRDPASGKQLCLADDVTAILIPPSVQRSSSDD